MKKFISSASSAFALFCFLAAPLKVFGQLGASQAIPATTLTANVAAPSFVPVVASGGTAPYTYTVAPALPQGLAFDASTGAISGTLAGAAISPIFVGAEAFTNGGTRKWPTTIPANPVAVLTFTNGRLEYSKGAGAGISFRVWDGDITTSGTRTVASFNQSWIAEVTVTNTFSSPTEFATVGFEIFGGGGGYSALMLSSSSNLVSVRAEDDGVATTVSTLATVVRLRLMWDSGAKQLTRSFSTDGGVSYSMVGAPFTPPTGSAQWSGALTSGFGIEVFGNSNAAAAIPSGAIFLDDFKVTASVPTTFTVTVTDALAATATNKFALTLAGAVTPFQQADFGLGTGVVAGSVVDFQVGVVGTPPLSVQWKRNGVNIPGAVSAPDSDGIAHYFLMGAQTSDVGPLTAVLTDATGTSAPGLVQQAMFVAPKVSWQWRHPYPTSQVLNNVVAQQDGGFHLFGNRGYFAESSDGVNFRPAVPFTSNTMGGYRFGNGRHLFWSTGGMFVTVGRNVADLKTSYISGGEFPNEVVFGNGLFVAVCLSGKIFTSPDGFVWTPRASGVTERIFEAAFGNDQFVASTASGQILRSADGMTWSAPTPSPTADVFLLRFAKDRFFLGSSTGQLYSSTDAVTWTPRTSGVTTTLTDLAYASDATGDHFVLVGSSGVIRTSTTGDNFVAATINATPAVNSFLQAVAYSNGKWCAVGGSGIGTNNPAVLLSSTDNGATWTRTGGSLAPVQFNGIAANNTGDTATQSIVTVGNSGNLLRSPDGWQWSKIAADASGSTLNDVTFSGAYFAAGAAGAIRTSTDNGLTWTNLVSNITDNLFWVGSLKGVLHVAGAGGKMSSYNGAGATAASWTTVATGIGAGETIQGAAYGAVGAIDTYVAVGTNGTIRVSLNNTANWGPATSGTAQALNEVAFANGTFVTVGNGGTVLRSTNGTAWTNQSFGLPENFTHVTHTGGANGVFVISGSASGSFVSSDGLTWALKIAPTSNGTGLRATTRMGGKFYGAGINGVIMAADLDPVIEHVSVGTPVAGGPANFRVDYYDPLLPVAFQWARDGFNIPGATGPSYTLPNTTRADAGPYSVTLATSVGAKGADPVVLAVAPTAYPGIVAADPAFNPNPVTISTRIFAVTKLLDGKWLVGGEFVGWDSHPTTGLVRLNADLSLDTSYTAPLINGVVHALATHSDGSVYVGGDFTAVDGHLRPGLARLTPALQHDLGWQAGDNAPLSTVSALVVRADGKIYVARTSSGNGVITGTNVVRRLHANGAHDADFSVNIAVGFGRIYGLTPAPANTLIINGAFDSVGGLTRSGVAKVSDLGALDATFAGMGTNAGGAVFTFTALPDGRYLAGGGFNTIGGVSRNRLAILSSAGAVDPGFVPVSSAVANSTNGNIHSATLLSDGRIFAGGNFSSFAGTSTFGLIRFTPTGALDLAYTAGTASAVGLPATGLGRNLTAYTLAGDAVALFGSFQSILDQRRVGVAVVNASGTLAASPSALAYRPAYTNNAFVDANGRLTVFGSVESAAGVNGLQHAIRLHPNGTIDNSFPVGTGFGPNGLSTFGVFRTVRQGDGKFVVIGDFVSYNGVPASRLLRLNVDGTLDTSFNAGSGPSTFIAQILSLRGGKTLLYGYGSGITYNGVLFPRPILRLNANGQPDVTFDVRAFTFSANGSITSIVEMDDGDGSLFVAGGFTAYDSVPVPGMVVIRPDGSRAPDFNPGTGIAGGNITGVEPSSHGVYFFGSFTTFNGASANRIVRYDPSQPGLKDPGFVASAAVNGTVGQVIAQEDGKLIVVGDFTGGPVVRLLSNGALDSTFALRGLTGFPGSNGASLRLAIADDGSVYAFGTVLSLNYGPPRALARFSVAPSGPVIAQGPASVSPALGTSAVLSVKVTGTAPFTYQWKKDGANLPGATGSVLVLNNVQAVNAGSYSVMVSNGVGTPVTSATALVNGAAPTIVQGPVDTVAVNGGTVTLSVVATGVPAPTYQWKFGADDIPGANGPALRLRNIQPSQFGNYTVTASNTFGNAPSSPAIVSLANSAGTVVSLPGFQRPQFRRPTSPARVTAGLAGSVYASWVNGRSITGANHQRIGAVIRLTSAGALDDSFVPGAVLADATPVIPLADGTVIVGGVAAAETRESGPALYRVFRLNANGSVDPAFKSPVFAASARYLTRQPDGKILVATSVGALEQNGGIAGLIRLNADGSLDGGFALPNFGTGGVFAPMLVDAANRIVIGGTFSTVNGTARAGVARLNADGTLDATFVPSGYTFSGPQIRGLGFQTQGVNAGKILVAGGTMLVGGTARPVIRLMPNGSLDPAFTLVANADLGIAPNLGQRPRLLNVLPDDRFTTLSMSVARFTAEGALDGTFTRLPFSAEAFWMETLPNGTVLVAPEQGMTIGGNAVSGPVRLTDSGVIDAGFVPPSFQSEFYPEGFELFADGRFFTGGNMTTVNGVARPGVARLNPNGTLDSFVLSGVPNLFSVGDAVPLPNGQIVAGVRVGSNEQQLTSSIARFDASGAVDPSFVLDPSITSAAFEPLSDNKLLSWSLNASALLNGSSFFKRVNTNGSIDGTFVGLPINNFGAVYRDAGGNVTEIVQGTFEIAGHYADGRALAIASTGAHPAGATTIPITVMRLNADGTKDATFVAPSINWATSSGFTTSILDPVKNITTQFSLRSVGGSPFSGVVLRENGGMLVFGSFTALGGQPAPGLARLTNSGALDTRFNVGAGAQLRAHPGRFAQIQNVAFSPNGQIWVTGLFDTFNGQNAPGIVRLNADGSVDPTFATDIAYEPYLGNGTKLAVGAGGEVLVAGTFMKGGDVFPFGIHRLGSPIAPVITSPPVASLAVVTGNPIILEVNITPGMTAAYQWNFNGTPIPLANQSSYLVPGAQAANIGSYTVTVTTPAGFTTSNPSLVDVGPNRSLVSLSARRAAGGVTGDFDVAFTVEGGERQVLLRAVGPTIGAAPFNIAGAMADPKIEIYRASDRFKLAENDDWTAGAATAAAQVGAFPLLSGSKDAALVTTLPAGTYTAKISGVNGSSGTVFAEVYLVDAAPRISHFAYSKGESGGESAAFAVGGTVSRQFLIRAVGRSFAGPTGLADPRLKLFNSAGAEIAANDNWGSVAGSSAIAAAQIKVGTTPLPDNSLDAALLVTLAPGNYSAQIDGVGSSTGRGLLEIFEVDDFRPNAAPVVLSPIAGQTLTQGNGFSITSYVVGKPGLTYAWTKNGAPFPSATGPSINISNAQVADGGTYVLTATNSAGFTTATYVVTVNAATLPTIVAAPLVAQSITTTANLSVNAAGSPPLTYQWYRGTSGVTTTPVATGVNYTTPILTESERYWVKVTNVAGQTIDSPTIPVLAWTPRNPPLTTNGFNGFAYGNATYVGVGFGGVIAKSTNGQTWSRVAGIASFSWRGVAYGGGTANRFVAVGDSGGAARISYSTDGQTWTAANPATGGSLFAVAWDGARFVAVGSGSTVLTSTDGANWSPVTLGTTNVELRAVVKGGATWVAAGTGGALHTWDGAAASWTSRTSGTPNNLASVAFNGTKFIAVGAFGAIVASTDGTGSTWTPAVSGTTSNLNAATSQGGAFLVFGGTTFLSSSDGTTWPSANFLSGSSASINAVIFANGRYVAGGFPGVIYSSSTAAANSWTLDHGSHAMNMLDAIYADGRFVAVGANGTVARSIDGGNSWAASPVVSNIFNTLRRVTYGKGLYVAVGDSGKIFTSSDATSWVDRSLGNSNFLAVTFAAGKFIAAGANGVSAVSSDGFSWSAGPTIGTGNVTGLDVGAGTVVAVSSLGGIHTSTDLVTWTPRTSGTALALNNVVFTNGQFFAVGAGSTILGSVTGTSWTPRNVGVAGINFSDIAYSDGAYLAVQNSATTNNTAVYLSRDSLVWNASVPSANVTTQFSNSGLASGNGTFLFVGGSGIIAQTIPAADTVRISTQPQGQVLANTNPVTLSVGAIGTGLNYQWFDGASGEMTSPIGGATAATFTTPALVQSKRYWVRVSGPGGVVIDSATASLLGAPTIVAAPQSRIVNDGTTVSFNVGAIGAPTLTYQWRLNNVTIPGATSSSYTLTPATLANAGSYSVVVSNTQGIVTSSGANLSLTPIAPIVGAVTSAFGRNVPVGANNSLSVTVTGTQPLSYQWRFNDAPIPGATGATYFISNASPVHAGNYSVSVSNSLGTGMSGTYGFTVSPELGWTWRNPRPTGAPLSTVTFANGQFFMGGLRSTLLVSTNGIDWSRRAVPGTGNIFGFLHANGLYVALGGLNSIFTSPDGIAWTARDSKITEPEQLQAIAHGAGRFVVVGPKGQTTTSTDGFTWTRGSLPTTEYVVKVAFLNGRFYASSFGNNNAKSFWTSTDGLSWAQLSLPANRIVDQIAFNENPTAPLYVATSDRDFMFTTDPTNPVGWTVVSHGLPVGTFFNDLRFLNGQFIAYGNNGLIVTSNDGANWITRTPAGVDVLVTGVAHGNGIYVASGQGYELSLGRRSILTSPDTQTWTQQVTGPAQSTQLNAVVSGGGKLAAVGNLGIVIASSDGLVWTDAVSNTTTPLNDVAHGAGVFVAVGASGRIIAANDPAGAWVVQTSGTNQNLRNVKFGNGLFVAVGDNGITLSSPNGTAWTKRAEFGSQLWGTAFGATTAGNVQVAVGNTGGLFSTINTGAADTASWTWTTRSAGLISTGYSDVIFAGNQFVAVGLGGLAATSNDGLVWAQTPAFTSDDLTGLAFVGGNYIAAGSLSTTYYTSTNGVNWTPRYTGSSDRLRDMTVHGTDQVFAVGNNGAVLSAGRPSIVAQPQSLNARAGAQVRLVALAAASPIPVTYQWFKDGLPVAGGTAPTLNLSGLTVANQGVYRLEATNAFGLAVSNSATVNVSLAPTIVAQPQGMTRIAGQTAIFTGNAAGTPVPTYRWTKDNVNLLDGPGIAGAATNMLTLTGVDANSAAAYRLVATNTPAGELAAISDTSEPAVLTVIVPPAPTIVSANPGIVAGAVSVISGNAVTFTAAATGTATISYQWRHNGLNLSNGINVTGANTATLMVTNVPQTVAGAITVAATNAGGTVVSTPVTLNVAPKAPVIVSPLTVFGLVGAPFNYFTALNGTTATFAAVGLPAGLAIEPTTGVVSGIPTAFGTTSAQITATNVTNFDTKTVTFTINPPPPVITSPVAVLGRVGQSLTYTIVATNLPNTFAAGTSLPAGLNRVGATISGTPLQAGTFTVTIGAANATGGTNQLVQFTILPALNAPLYSGTTQPGGKQNSPFTFTAVFTNPVNATNGYAITSGALPTGVVLNVDTGVLSGTPSVLGTFAFGLTATGPGGSTIVPFTLVINPPDNAPVVTSASIANATRGEPFSFSLLSDLPATGFVATGLPSHGLSMPNPANGVITGTPNASGSVTLQVAATNGAGTGPTSVLVITINPSPSAPVISSAPVVEGTVGVAFSYQLEASNAPTSFAVTSGTLPAPLALTPGTGAIAGTPTTAGDTRVWIAATNTTGGTGSSLEILFRIKPALDVPVVTSNSTAAGRVGQQFTYPIIATNDPDGFDATGLPSWLSRSGAQLSGIPDTATTQPIVIQVFASKTGVGTSAAKEVSISIAPAPATPLITSAGSASGGVGLNFTYQTTASESATSFGALNLPPGLVLNPASGLISGMPTMAGPFVATLSAGNTFGLGITSPLVFSIAPAPLAPAITSPASTTGKVGVAFAYSILPGPATITSYALSGTLPLGVTLNTSTGVISGNPAAPGVFSVQLTVTNANGTSLPQTLVLVINPADNVPVITSPTIALGTVGVAFNYAIEATNIPGSTPFAAPITLDAVGLPSGLVVQPATGVIQGIPSVAGDFNATLVGTNLAGAGPYRGLRIIIQPSATAPVVTSDAAASAQVGVAFGYQIRATNNPQSYDVVGAPAWMSVNGQSGAISGTPTTPGTFVAQLVARNSAGSSNPAGLTLFVSAAANTPVIGSSRTAVGTMGTPFSFQLGASGAGPFSFVATGLPAGLGIVSSSGLISGTPQASGVFHVTVSANNANGAGQPVILVITINPTVQIR